MSDLEASAQPPVAQASMRAPSLTSSPKAVTSLRPAVTMRPMYSVAPQWSPNRSYTSDAEISVRAAISVSVSRSARAAMMHDLAATDSDPAVSARKKATTPSPS